MFFLDDLRFSIRAFGKSPGFVLIAVLTLALGVGANTAIFSVVDTVLVKGLPYRDPRGLVLVTEQIPSQPRVNFSPNEFARFEKEARSFSSISAAAGNGFTLARRDAEPRATFGQLVTPNLFETLGIQPRLGRAFTPGEEHAVVLSDGLWRETFQSDPRVLGTAITLNDEPYTIVGVMPAGFEYPDARYQVWIPANLSKGIFQKFREAHMLTVIARVRPGATAAAVHADVDAFTRELAQSDANSQRRIFTVDLQTAMTGDYQKPLLILMAAVGALLLIACANVANLVFARAVFRTREFAVRAAIGAPRWRLVAQLLTESLMLGIGGGAAGLFLGMWGVKALIRLNPGRVPFIEETRLDARVLLFTMAVSIATSCLFGLAPAVSTARSRLFDIMKQSGRGTLGGGRRLRRILVFAQVALATVLLAIAGLMIRSLAALESVPSGLRPGGVLTAGVVMTEQSYPEAPQMLGFYRRVLAETRGMPGVEGAAIATHLPFTGQRWGNTYQVEGRPSRPDEQYVASIRPVSPGYFAVLGVPVSTGRPFQDSDNASGAPVAMINLKLAQQFWPNESPVGKRLNVDGPWRTIVGVAANVKPGRLDEPAEPEIYLPYEQMPPNLMKFLGRALTILVRSPALDPGSLTSGVRAAVRNADKSVAVRDVRTMPDLIAGTLAQPRFRTMLLGIFSALALLLATIGIYGVISYSVTQRVQEIGVRVALGASTGDIIRMVVRDAARLAIAGVAVGLVAALAAGRSVATLLFEVQPYDPMTLSFVAALLLAVALLASFVPARRASRVDAMASLRNE